MTHFSFLSILIRNVVLVQGDGAWLQDAGGDTGPTSSVACTRIGQEEQHSLWHGYSRRGDYVECQGVRIDQAGRETHEGFEWALARRLARAHDVDAASVVALREVGMLPGLEGSPKPNGEVGKLPRRTDAIRGALALLGEEPLAHTAEVGTPLQRRGDQ